MAMSGPTTLVLSVAVCAVAMPLLLRVLRRVAVVDHPGARSSHTVATLRGGGAAVALATVAAFVLATKTTEFPAALLIGGSIGLGIAGLVDDVKTLPVIPRLAVQTLVAATTTWWWLADVPGKAGYALVVGMFVVGYVNSFNFMDGINGITVAQIIAATGAWWIVAAADDHSKVIGTAAPALLGAAVVFLPFNFPRARVFAGDVGSYFCGGWISLLACVCLAEGFALTVLFAPLAVYILDTATTMFRRLRRHEKIWEPHRDHAYQRLAANGWGHTRSTGTAFLAMAVPSAYAILTRNAGAALRATSWILTLAFASLFCALPTLMNRSS
jgi:UDP-GlcNAc:undecaprenyl-phosphate/decaprenyl-phosphate GlcNAc-1-phosphate transferase